MGRRFFLTKSVRIEAFTMRLVQYYLYVFCLSGPFHSRTTYFMPWFQCRDGCQSCFLIFMMLWHVEVSLARKKLPSQGWQIPRDGQRCSVSILLYTDQLIQAPWSLAFSWIRPVSSRKPSLLLNHPSVRNQTTGQPVAHGHWSESGRASTEIFEFFCPATKTWTKNTQALMQIETIYYEKYFWDST